MITNKPPTEPGDYHWREKEGDAWQILNVENHVYNNHPLVCELSYYNGEEMDMRPVKGLEGQWSRIPKPDEGAEATVISNKEGVPVGIGGTTKEACQNFLQGSDCPESNVQTLIVRAGYTCKKVRIFKEVEG